MILRVDYFENYAGRFLSVEAKDRRGGVQADGTGYEGPDLSLSFNSGAGTPIDSTPRVMNVNVDPDTTPDTYIEHRVLVRIGDAGVASPAAPTQVRVGSSAGGEKQADVNVWLGGGLPPMGHKRLSDFTTDYMDPSQVYERFEDLAAEFPNIAELITLPNKTNGYQRKAQANMSGTTPIGNSPSGATAQSQTVVLTSRAWGHEGGNDIQAEFVNPGTPDQALSVSVAGNVITVRLGDELRGRPLEHRGAGDRGDQRERGCEPAGRGAHIPRKRRRRGPCSRTRSSTCRTSWTRLTTVPRGPYEYKVMRIGRKRDGSKVGVFLYCQQHAREWATPLTCLETAEQLLRNYVLDGRTRELVNNLDIFILPSSNPDGAHYSMYDFTQQRRNLTNHCVNGGKETDDPLAPGFWTPRTNPQSNLPYTNTDPASRDLWGVDLNRNNTAGTIFDGFIGASHSCTSDTFAGPAEASEPEIKNEHWVADTFTNIKFSNNIHSFGGYFMWAPGAYLPNRDEGALVHANIGVEKYFFAAGDRILNRIKDVRGTAILPERTGPIADVLYSAAGNSADEHWYNRDVIAYSFETGADRFVNTSLSVASAAGATGIRVGNRTGFRPGDTIKIDLGTAKQEVRTVESVAASNPPSPNPNITLTTALSQAHDAGAVVGGGVLQSGVGFQPDYDRRASTRRSSSRRATSACSSRRSTTRWTRRRRRSP